MGFPAYDRSAGRIVADAFGVRHATLRALIAELEHGPRLRRADDLAQKLGLRNRFQLAHLLMRHDLPTLVDLRAILRVVIWVQRWETHGLSLVGQALSEGRDPAAYSKTVRRVAGRPWSEIRMRGTDTVARALAARFRGGSQT
jgi:hypothetical protein